MSLERSPQFEEYVAVSVEIPEVIDDGDSEPEPIPEPETPEVIDTDTIAVETAVLMCGGKKEEWERGDFYVEKVGRLESEGMVGASGEIAGTDYEGEYAEQHELMLTSLRERAGEGFLKSFDIEETNEAYRLHATIAVIDGEGWITYAHFVREELKEVQETQEMSLIETEAQFQEDTEIISRENEELPMPTESPTPVSEVVEVAQIVSVDREVEEGVVEAVPVEAVQKVAIEIPVTDDREEAHEEAAPSLEVSPVVMVYEEPADVLVVEESYVEAPIEAQKETQIPVAEVASSDLRQEIALEKITETVLPVEVQEAVVTQVFVAPTEKGEAQGVNEFGVVLASTEVTPVPDIVIEANQTSVEATASILVEHKENREIISDRQIEARIEETDQNEEIFVERPIEKPEAAIEDVAVAKETKRETTSERLGEEMKVIPEAAIEVTNEEVVAQEHLHDALNTLFTQELFTTPVENKVIEEVAESEVAQVEVPVPTVQATAEVLPFIARRAPAATQQPIQAEEQVPTTNSSRNGIRMRRAIAA